MAHSLTLWALASNPRSVPRGINVIWHSKRHADVATDSEGGEANRSKIHPRPGHHGGPSGPCTATSMLKHGAYPIAERHSSGESTMSKKAQRLPRPLYRWTFVLLPILAVVASACGTGGNGGGFGY